MQTVKSKIEQHPGGDERYKAIDRAMKRFQYEKDALLEVLNTAQETFGFLSQELLLYVARHLKVPISQVYGVATFYHMFTFKPLGEHNCIVCAGTACHVKGSGQIVKAISDEYQIKAGGTTPDGQLSLTIARCLGSCGLAPVAVLDGMVHSKQTPDTVSAIVKDMVTRPRDEKTLEAG